MDAILQSLVASGVQLALLGAGYLDLSLINRRFFDRILVSCNRLKTIELMFGDPGAVIEEGWHGLVDSTKFDVMTQRLTKKGTVSSFLGALPDISSISISFCTLHNDPFVFPAAFHNIMSGGVRWHQLRNIQLAGIEVEQQDMLDFLELHRDTLRTVRLCNVRLLSTSGTRLMRRMKEIPRLDDVLIWGWLYGKIEDMGDYDKPTEGNTLTDHEAWWLGDPQDIERVVACGSGDPWERVAQGLFPTIRKGYCLANDLAKWFLEDGPYPLTHPKMRSRVTDYDIINQMKEVINTIGLTTYVSACTCSSLYTGAYM